MTQALQRREVSLAVAILAVAVVLAFAAPAFFTFANQRDLLLANMPVLIVALGMVLVILTGQIDISVGSQFAICSVSAGVFAHLGLPTPLAGTAACLIGALMGAVNGALVAWVGIPSIVVTLATMVALRDGLRWVTQGAWVQDLPPDFQWFGQSQTASEIITIVCAAALTVGVSWGLRNLAAGRVVYATGSDPNAARLMGINPSRVVFAVFVITGALTGFAAVFNAVRFHQIPEQRRPGAGTESDRRGGGGRSGYLGWARHHRRHHARIAAAGCDRPGTYLSGVQRLLGARDRRRHHTGRGIAGCGARPVKEPCRHR